MGILDALSYSRAQADARFAQNPARIVIDTGKFDSNSTTTTSIGNIGRGYSMPDAANTSIGATIDFPSDWHTIHVDAYFVPTATASGNVVLQVSTAVITDGALLTNNLTTAATTTVAVPAVAFTVKVARVATSVAVDPAGQNYLRVLRVGGDANDTSTNTISIFQLLITKAS